MAKKKVGKAATVLKHPTCECGWIGDSPAVVAAGCPKCGERIMRTATKAELAKLEQETELEEDELEEDEDELEDELEDEDEEGE